MKGIVKVSNILAKGGKKQIKYGSVVTNIEVNNWDALVKSKHIEVIEEKKEEVKKEPVLKKEPKDK